MQRQEIEALLGRAVSRNGLYFPGDAGDAIPSAVLVIIHYHDNGRAKRLPRVILTKRSAHLKTHSSEISFPGGRHTKSDASLIQTALRETEEEIGIRISERDVVGSLRAVRTMTSNHFIVPFVTIQQSFAEHRLQALEVEELIDAPLLDILKSISADTEHYGLARDAVRFTFGDYVIWGATARILKQLYEILIRPS